MIIAQAKLIGAAASLAAVIVLGWYLHYTGYQSGERAAEARMQTQVDIANRNAARIERQRREQSESHGREIETLRDQRDAEAARARNTIQPVRLCTHSTGGGGLPDATDTPATAPPSDRGGELPVHPGRDIGPTLLVLVGACQRDHDTAVGWQRWWADQQRIVP